MGARIGFAVFDALAPTPKIGWAQFDAAVTRPSVGWVEFDVRDNPNDNHDSLESQTDPGGRRRTVLRATVAKTAPPDSRSDYHSRSDEQERLLAAQLDDEEVVIAFLMELALA